MYIYKCQETKMHTRTYLNKYSQQARDDNRQHYVSIVDRRSVILHYSSRNIILASQCVAAKSLFLSFFLSFFLAQDKIITRSPFLLSFQRWIFFRTGRRTLFNLRKLNKSAQTLNASFDFTRKKIEMTNLKTVARNSPDRRVWCSTHVLLRRRYNVNWKVCVAVQLLFGNTRPVTWLFASLSRLLGRSEIERTTSIYEFSVNQLLMNDTHDAPEVLRVYFCVNRDL